MYVVKKEALARLYTYKRNKSVQKSNLAIIFLLIHKVHNLNLASAALLANLFWKLSD